KGVSGRLLRRDRPDIAVRYYYKGVLWSPGYFASSCGGAPISVIRQYIEQQQTPGQVENRALYPRPEGRGFTAHWIKSWTQQPQSSHAHWRCPGRLTNGAAYSVPSLRTLPDG
ncbi:transposase, partial [Escherichia coli]|nr:transposase [Escherichia coli]